MIRLPESISRFGNRPLLIGFALVLLVLNLIRFALAYYEEKEQTIDSRLALLDRYQASVKQAPELLDLVTSLEQQKKTFENYLFTGASEEEIASAMQILLQEQIVKAGMEPESLRPLRSGESGKGKDYGEISIKIRSAGTLSEFVQFLANLYSSQQLFLIESFTLKPYNQSELKIFIDFKGYYKLV